MVDYHSLPADELLTALEQASRTPDLDLGRLRPGRPAGHHQPTPGRRALQAEILEEIVRVISLTFCVSRFTLLLLDFCSGP